MRYIIYNPETGSVMGAFENDYMVVEYPDHITRPFRGTDEVWRELVKDAAGYYYNEGSLVKKLKTSYDKHNNNGVG